MKKLAIPLIALTLIISCSETNSYSSRLLNAGAEDESWLLHGRTYDESRFSPLKDINDSNVGELGLSWSFETGTNRGHETTPIVVDGMMFITAPWSVVFALDAKTGKEIWSFDPEADKAWARNACCDVVNRGVAVWGDDVVFATIDGRLISLDKESGEVNWDVLTIDKSKPYTITGAPRIIDKKIIIGNGGGEFGVRGYISAYDVEDGSMLWRFFTVPGNPDEPFESEALAKAAKTWSGGKWWEIGGGGTVWDSMAYDPELNLLYIGTGNGSPWNRYVRSPGGGDNLYLSSIVAINPNNGEYVWHYQTTPGDTWDYTATQHMILADMEIDGEQRKVIMQAPKNGFFYVIDRTSGEFISANNFVPTNWASHIDPKTGRPVEIVETNHELQPALTTPGPLGGHNWHPMSYSPQTGLVYIPAQETIFIYSTDNEFKYNPNTWNLANQIEMSYLPKDPDELAMVDAATVGYLLAWDPKEQKEVWRAQYKRPWSGGVLSTDGN
jgi:PQQ-dependent dehydrogenase (methanol/ethanol family)